MLGFLTKLFERRTLGAPHAGQALRESEDRFRLLVEQVQDYAIFMLDPEGRVATWNVGAERLKGYRADEIIGHSAFQKFLKITPPGRILVEQIEWAKSFRKR